MHHQVCTIAPGRAILAPFFCTPPSPSPEVCACGELLELEMERDQVLCVNCAAEASERQPQIDRFMAKIYFEPMSGCWIWGGAIWGNGYGYHYTGNRRGVSAHRFSYEIHKGVIPEGMHVLHSCHTPACCNPDHLQIGSHQENMVDRKRSGRWAHGERMGSAKLSQANVDEIRALHAEGLSQKQLAEVFKVHNSHISRILSGKYWPMEAEAAGFGFGGAQ